MYLVYNVCVELLLAINSKCVYCTKSVFNYCLLLLASVFSVQCVCWIIAFWIRLPKKNKLKFRLLMKKQWLSWTFLENLVSTFGKLRKWLLASSCPSVRSSVRNNSAPPKWILMKFDISFFWKYVEKIQVSLKSDKNNGYITWRIFTFITVTG